MNEAKEWESTAISLHSSDKSSTIEAKQGENSDILQSIAGLLF